MVSQTLAHYKVIAPLGKGGMGEVYLAEDKKLDRKVALKVLPAEMAADPERLARFQREARAVAALNHPNIVTIYSVEEADGVHFLTMELVEGRPLTDTLREEGLSLSEFLEIAIPLSEAFAAAHAKGITHRDIKPPNVMITSDGRIKVLDFGLAKMAPRRVEDDSQSELATEARTREGMILGTAPYMSPEQVEGRTVDPGSDIFSLGIVLFEMATGERPFRGRSAMSLLSSILKDEPPSVAELKPELPKGLSSIIRRCLAKDPDDRYRTATELLEALTRVAEEETSSSAPRLSPLGRDVETERTHRTPLASRDDELAQHALLRASAGIGGMQVRIAERDPDLLAVLPHEIRIQMEIWLVMHEDLRASRPVRLLFDHLARELTDFVKGRSRDDG